MDGNQVFWIQEGERALGCCLNWKLDCIFIQCSRVWHPFDLVAMTLYELSHQMVNQSNHHKVCWKGHCLVGWIGFVWWWHTSFRTCVCSMTTLFATSPKTTSLQRWLEEHYGKDRRRKLVTGNYMGVRSVHRYWVKVAAYKRKNNWTSSVLKSPKCIITLWRSFKRQSQPERWQRRGKWGHMD